MPGLPVAVVSGSATQPTRIDPARHATGGQEEEIVMTEYKLVAFTNPVEGREEEFNSWYEGRHIDDVLAIPGILRAQRFESANPVAAGAAEFKYMAIYDIETDDVAALFDQFATRSGTESMPISDALDRNPRAYFYRPSGPAKQRPA